jgi:hypothetical protein
MRKKTAFKNSRGSILVGAVALAMLTAIAGMGFLMVSTNGINSETAALENEKAFAAAESGVWLGARWLRDPANDFLTTPDGATLNPFGSEPVPINGLNVVVSIPVKVTDGIPVASIVANVYSGDPGPATFKKRISVGNVTNQGFGVYCTFYSGYQPVDANKYNAATQTWTNDWGGLGDNRNFYGRTHFDGMPVILYTAGPRFYGPVTVSNKVTAGLGAAFTNGQRGNDYSSGVVGALQNTGSGYSPSLDDLNAIFTDHYTANVDPIALNIPLTNATSLDSALPVTRRIILDDSHRLDGTIGDDGYGPYQYRPTLYFNGQSAYYQYSDINGNYQFRSYGAVVGGTIDGMVFLSLHNNLNVFSTANGVTGNVTVATAMGRSIVPVGNLTTSDYDSTNVTIPSSSNNMIGLISGGYIAFNKTWTRNFVADGAVYTTSDNGIDVNKFVSEKVSGGANNNPPGNRTPAAVGKMHITASIMAVNHFWDNLYNGAAYQNFWMSGTEWWDGMWGQLPVSPNGKPFNDPANKAEDYSLQLYGNHILAAYARTYYGITVRGCQGTTTFTPDPRMTTRNLQPPGFPGVSNPEDPTTNLLTLVLRDWKEGN